jgi:hypothetical protein
MRTGLGKQTCMLAVGSETIGVVLGESYAATLVACTEHLSIYYIGRTGLPESIRGTWRRINTCQQCTARSYRIKLLDACQLVGS